MSDHQGVFQYEALRIFDTIVTDLFSHRSVRRNVVEVQPLKDKRERLGRIIFIGEMSLRRTVIATSARNGILVGRFRRPAKMVKGPVRKR
ncbi:MAG: hypothetical protein ABGX05_01720 [Pirellulaceae bacterium]